jgi:uroporphyrinogen-III synthase
VTSSAERPLVGRKVVVTRSLEQSSELTRALKAAGAQVIAVPTIAIVEPLDGGAELRACVARFKTYKWIVVTSANAARRLVELAPAKWPKIAVVGKRTASALPVAVDLVPARSDGAGLVEAFPKGTGRVLVPQGDRASSVVVDGLRAKGWTVDTVVAYRTVSITVTPKVASRVAAADAITFTSPSTLDAFVGRPLPSVVVVIGQATAAAARKKGFAVSAVAARPTPAAIVSALTSVLV